MIAVIAGTASLLIWIYLVLAHGGFWRVSKHMPPIFNQTSSCRVAVIVPARNEADVIGRCITSLLGQAGPHLIRILLVDDGSSDGTAAIAREASVRAGKLSALVILEGKPLQAGWTGKLWAVHQGIESARDFAPQFLLLTDGDILHAPDSIAMLVSVAESGGYDLVSFMVKLHCATLAEKLLIPAFVFFFFKLYPPAWIANPHRKIAGAAGGSILVRPDALERTGGISAIRNELIDDCALAAAVKSHGGKVWLGLSQTTISLRSYGSLSEIGRMISRSAFYQLRHSLWLLLVALAGMMLVYMLPPILILSHHRLPVALGTSAWLLMALAYRPMARFYGLSPLWSLALPLIAFFYMAATLHSAFSFWSGSGGEWKGRVQDRPNPLS
jgi:hopene-associated glycosyltransferase HpnB